MKTLTTTAQVLGLLRGGGRVTDGGLVDAAGHEVLAYHQAIKGALAAQRKELDRRRKDAIEWIDRARQDLQRGDRVDAADALHMALREVQQMQGIRLLLGRAP